MLKSIGKWKWVKYSWFYQFGWKEIQIHTEDRNKYCPNTKGKDVSLYRDESGLCRFQAQGQASSAPLVLLQLRLLWVWSSCRSSWRLRSSGAICGHRLPQERAAVCRQRQPRQVPGGAGEREVSYQLQVSATPIVTE